MSGSVFEKVISAAVRDRIVPSDTTEMNDLIAEYDALSFCAGDPGLFISPREGLRDAFVAALDSREVWAYNNDPFGDMKLRSWIVDRMDAKHVAPKWVSPDSVMLTNGGSEGMNFVAEALIDPGSFVIVEGPTYNEALMTFRRHGAVCVAAPTDEDGIIPEALEEMPEAARARFIYTIPNFQNPTGRTSSAARRRALIDFAARHDIAILEDDPYRTLAFDGEPPESFLSLAGDDRRVIYSSSFSKMISTGIRTAWLVIPPELVAAFGAMRMSQGICLPQIVQRAVFNYLSEVDQDSRIESVKEEFHRRAVRALDSAVPLLSPLGFHAERPNGGMFLWFEADDSVRADFSSDDFARYAVSNEQIGVLPGTVFYPRGSGMGRRAFRVSTAKAPTEILDDGFSRLAKALRSFLQSR